MYIISSIPDAVYTVLGRYSLHNSRYDRLVSCVVSFTIQASSTVLEQICVLLSVLIAVDLINIG